MIRLSVTRHAKEGENVKDVSNASSACYSKGMHFIDIRLHILLNTACGDIGYYKAFMIVEITAAWLQKCLLKNGANSSLLPTVFSLTR